MALTWAIPYNCQRTVIGLAVSLGPAPGTSQRRAIGLAGLFAQSPDDRACSFNAWIQRAVESRRAAALGIPS